MPKIGKNAYKNVIFPILIGSCFEQNKEFHGYLLIEPQKILLLKFNLLQLDFNMI